MRTEEQAQPRQAKRPALPSWLNGQTIALLGGMIALGAFCQNGFSSLRQDLNGLRTEFKGEIHALREELKGDIAALREELKADIATLREELKGDIAALREELKADMGNLRVELKGDVSELRTDLRRLDDRTRGVEVALVGNNVRLDNLERAQAGADDLAERTPPPTDTEPAERVAQGR